MMLFRTAVGICVFFVGLGWAHAESLCVTKSGTMLRTGPQNSASMSWKVPKYMPLAPTGNSKGGWIEVADVDGQKHWAPSNSVSSHMNCVVVKARKVRLRAGPGTQFDTAPAGVADRYSSFLDKGGEDGWTQVEDEMGQKGWVNLDQVWKPHHKMRMSFDDK